MLITALNRILVTLESQPSLISELWEYFKDKYFTPHYGEYEHIQVGTSSMVSFRMIVIAFFIGINLAAILAIFDKRVLGEFARKLIYEEALSPDRAMTISELGFYKNTAVRSNLRCGSTLKRVVRCVEEEQYNAALEQKRLDFEASGGKGFREVPFKLDLETAHFYIPEELKYTAEIKFEKKGTNWLTFLGVFVGSFAMMIAAFWLYPDILQLIDNFLSMF